MKCVFLCQVLILVAIIVRYTFIAELLYLGQENDVLVISGFVFRNQFYLARFQSANERRRLRPMRAKQAARALN